MDLIKWCVRLPCCVCMGIHGGSFMLEVLNLRWRGRGHWVLFMGYMDFPGLDGWNLGT